MEVGRRVARLVQAGIPVMGHVGLTPQSVHQFGGFKVQGRTEAQRGADPRGRARRSPTRAPTRWCSRAMPGGAGRRRSPPPSRCPTIGIGAGPGCDGQVLVMHDLLGLDAGVVAALRAPLRRAGARDRATRSPHTPRTCAPGRFPAQARVVRMTVRGPPLAPYAASRMMAEMVARQRTGARRATSSCSCRPWGRCTRGTWRLLRRGRGAAGDALVLSIFVNPTQFGPEGGPRQVPARPARRSGQGGAAPASTWPSCPTAATMYPPGYQTYVEVRELQQGAVRRAAARATSSAWPRWWPSCSTSCGPTSRIFGEKDFQQLAVIRRMVADLDLGVEIVGAAHGARARRAGDVVAQRLSVAGRAGRARWRCTRASTRPSRRPRPASDARRAAGRAARAPSRRRWIASTTSSCATPQTLAPVDDAGPAARRCMLVAAFVGSTRLIDNVQISV